MEIASACLLLSALSISFPCCAATLSITPSRSQFFSYHKISLKCVTLSNSSGWTVTRNTTYRTSQPCEFGWGIPGDSSCNMQTTKPTDTGVYWCESERGERSNTVNITVADGVILDSPQSPVMEGEDVTLGCSYKERTQRQSTSDFSASFYRYDEFIGKERKKILKAVSKYNEGFYQCEHPSKGKSKPTWLSVTVRAGPTVPPTSVAPTQKTPTQFDIWILVGGVLLLILYGVLTVVSIHIHRKLAQVRAYAKRRAASRLVEE